MPVSFADVVLSVVVAVVIITLSPVWYRCSCTDWCMCFFGPRKQTIQSTCHFAFSVVVTVSVCKSVMFCLHQCVCHQFCCGHPSVSVLPISMLPPSVFALISFVAAMCFVQYYLLPTSGVCATVICCSPQCLHHQFGPVSLVAALGTCATHFIC